VLAVTTLLHDIGLAEEFDGPLKFEVEGANAARRFGKDAGLELLEALLPNIAVAIEPGLDLLQRLHYRHRIRSGVGEIQHLPLFRQPGAHLFGRLATTGRAIRGADLFRTGNGQKTVSKVVDALIAAYLGSPEYGELIKIVNSVLERRLTPELVLNFRSVFLERRKRLAAALAVSLGWTPERMLPVTLHIFLHVPGLWTFCFPRKESKALLEMPQNRHLLVDFRIEMTLFLRFILVA
jgi:hypothetical protein